MVRKFVRACAIARALRSPGDAMLFVAIARFIVGLPAELGRHDVSAYVRELERSRRPRARDVAASFRRVVRIRDACLRLPGLWQRNTCYVRAFTLYRFLDSREHHVALHLGVEASRENRLRGHAWVTLDGELLEGPEAVVEHALNELVLDGTR